MSDPILHDFQDGRGPVPAHPHSNGGGWIADTATVDATARVSGDAQVYGDAQVSGNARVSGDAQVSGNAQVYGDAQVSGNASHITGRVLSYTFDAYPNASGAILLRYGCCLFPVDDWDTNLEALCRNHAPEPEEAEYVPALRALIALARLTVTLAT